MSREMTLEHALNLADRILISNPHADAVKVLAREVVRLRSRTAKMGVALSVLRGSITEMLGTEDFEAVVKESR